MKNLSEQEVIDLLCRAVSAITPDQAEKIWEQPVETAGGDAWFLDGTRQKNARPPLRYMRWASLAAACLAIIFVGWLRLCRVPDATVYLDANPGVSFNVNRLGRVIAVTADSKGGKIIADNKDLNNTDINTAVRTLISSMVQNGYLSPAENTLLLSVNGRDKGRAAALKKRVSVKLEQELNTLLGESVILGQIVEADEKTEHIADQYRITLGRAAFILRLLHDQPSWDIRQLAEMPISDLIRYCHASGIDITRYLGDNGEILGDLDSLLDKDDADDNDSNTPGSQDNRDDVSAGQDDKDDREDDRDDDDRDDDTSEAEDDDTDDADGSEDDDTDDADGVDDDEIKEDQGSSSSDRDADDHDSDDHDSDDHDSDDSDDADDDSDHDSDEDDD